MQITYKNFNLIIYLFGVFISGIGTRLTTIALSDKLIKLTGNDFSISLVFILQSIPILALGMLAGNIIDKSNKKISFILINLISSLTSLIFALTYNTLIIFSVILLNGIIQAFYIPVVTSLMPLLVDKKDLIKANAIKMSVNGVVMIAGYAFASILLNAAGSTTAFMLDSCSFIFVAMVSIFLKSRQNNTSSYNHPAANYKKDMLQGWNFIKTNAIIKHMFILDLLINFIISMQEPLTYIFVEKYLGGKMFMANRTALLFTFSGIGTIAGGIILRQFKSKNKLMIFSFSLIFDSILVIIFSLNRYFPISLLIFAGMGIVGSFTGSILQTVIQQYTPENLLGRVSGFINSIVQPLCVLSILIGGIFSNLIEVKWIFIIGSLLELLTGAYFIRKYRN